MYENFQHADFFKWQNIFLTFLTFFFFFAFFPPALSKYNTQLVACVYIVPFDEVGFFSIIVGSTILVPVV